MVVNVHPIKRDFDTYVQLKLLDKHGELGITMIKKQPPHKCDSEVTRLVFLVFMN